MGTTIAVREPSAGFTSTPVQNQQEADEALAARVARALKGASLSALPTESTRALPSAVKQFTDPEALKLVEEDGMTLQNLSPAQQNNPRIVGAALRKNGLALQHASKKLQNDPKTVCTAIKQNPFALEHASEERRGDVEGILYLVQSRKPEALKYATPRGRVLVSVQFDGMELKNLSPDEQNDLEIVSFAVQENGLALQYASKKFQNDPKIVLEAVRNNPKALQHASKELRSDIRILFYVCHSEALQYATPRGRALLVLCTNGMKPENLSLDLQKDPEIVAILNDPEVLQHASKLDLQALERDRLIYYLMENQNKSQEDAEEIAQKTQIFLESRGPELQDGTPKFYFSTDNKDLLSRTIHCFPNQNLTLICFNKRKTESGNFDVRLGSGDYKWVQEAFDYKTGKIYARVMNFTEIEEQCAELLKDVSGVVKTEKVYQYKSAKSGKEKRVAIQEKLEVGLISRVLPQQKQAVVKSILKTLEEIHARGITHGDLHPGNILCNAENQPKFIDFGLANIEPKDKVSQIFVTQDLLKITETIKLLCNDIQDTPPGKAFIEKMGKEITSASQALQAFESLNLSD